MLFLVPLFDYYYYQNQLQNLLVADSVTWKRISVCASGLGIRVVHSTVQKRLASHHTLLFTETQFLYFCVKKMFQLLYTLSTRTWTTKWIERVYVKSYKKNGVHTYEYIRIVTESQPCATMRVVLIDMARLATSSPPAAGSAAATAPSSCSAASGTRPARSAGSAPGSPP